MNGGTYTSAEVRSIKSVQCQVVECIDCFSTAPEGYRGQVVKEETWKRRIGEKEVDVWKKQNN